MDLQKDTRNVSPRTPDLRNICLNTQRDKVHTSCNITPPFRVKYLLAISTYSQRNHNPHEENTLPPDILSYDTSVSFGSVLND